MHFDEPKSIFLLLFFFLFIIAGVVSKLQMKKRDAITTMEGYPSLAKNLNARLRKLRFFLIGAALVIFPIALMDFKYGQEEIAIRKKKTDIIILLDVSLSMNSQDIFPTRLNRAKKEIESLIQSLNGERVALIAFANSSITLLPFTTDYRAFIRLLRKANPTWISSQGTSFATAFKSAENILGRSAADNERFVIVYSDGENHDGHSLAMARLLHNKMGARIFTVGIGTGEGASLQLEDPFIRRLTPQNTTDPSVITKLDTKTLEALAEAGDGLLVLPQYESFSFRRLSKEITKNTKTDKKTDTLLVGKSRHHYFVALLLFALCLELFLKERKEEK